jgi:hypothetical protein
MKHIPMDAKRSQVAAPVFEQAGNKLRMDGMTIPEGDCPKRTAWLEELATKYKAKYGRNTPND